MNRFFLYFFLFFCSFAIISCQCSREKPVQQPVDDILPVFVFNNQDSLDINELAVAYVNFVNSSDYEAAADLLYFVRNDSVLPISNEQRQGYLVAMRSLPILGCAQKELELYSDRDNKLRISLLINENGNLAEDKGTINFFLNPVKNEDKWYLTLLDKHAEGVGLYH